MKTHTWTYLPLLDALADRTALGNKVPQSEFKISGKVPIVDQGINFIAGYSDAEVLAWGAELPVVIFGDHTRAVKYVDFPFILGADGVKVLVPKKNLSAKFVYYYLLNLKIPSHGYARHFSHLKRSQIPVPPLAEQERIVKLLDQADGLRKLRAEADRRTDALVPALFHEMFGFPFANSLPYPVKKLRELVREGDKINYGVVQPGGEVPDGIPIVRAGDFSGMSIDRRHLKRISPEVEMSYRRSRLRGEIFFCFFFSFSFFLCFQFLRSSGFNIVRARAGAPLYLKKNKNCI